MARSRRRTSGKRSLGRSFAAVALPLVAIFGGIKGCDAASEYVYSEGARTGTVAKFSNKGVFNKTWEGELAMDNFRSTGDGTMTNSFNFSVQNLDLVEEIEDARDSGARVNLVYNQTLAHKPWRRDSQYLITGIEVIDPAPQAPASGPKPGAKSGQ